MDKKLTYADGILEAYEYLLSNHRDFFVIGQGLWSPWYVGSTMKDLDTKFGKERVIDCPISELATTGATVGAAICGYRPMIVHPRIDFMLLAIDQIVTQAAKWRHMFGGNSKAPATFRAIINRGGEQGAQHSQSLHSWFAHIPGLRVVMPYTASDARNLMISSVLCDDPVMYIDDRWLYDISEDYTDIEIYNIKDIKPKKIISGNDITLVGVSYSTKVCLNVAELIKIHGIDAEIFDLRALNPLYIDEVVSSVKKTGRLAVIDGDWSVCGVAGEIIAQVSERLPLENWKSSPQRFTLPEAPAPTSPILEKDYYLNAKIIGEKIISHIR